MSNIPTFVAFFLPLTTALLMLLYTPKSKVTRYLRRIELISIALFWASASVLDNLGITDGKEGAFWTVNLRWFYLDLPHPFDYWVLYQTPRAIVFVSLISMLTCSMAYWWLLRQEKFGRQRT